MEQWFEIYEKIKSSRIASVIVVSLIVYVLVYQYNNINVGRDQCETKCLAAGADDFSYVPQRTNRGIVYEAQCTCYTPEYYEKQQQIKDERKFRKDVLGM